MKRREFITLVGGASVVGPRGAVAQSLASDNASVLIVGAWAFASAANINANGNRTDRWGPDATGIQIFDNHGYFSMIITRPKSLIFGSKAFYAYGSYSIDSSNSSVVMMTAKIKGNSTTGSDGVVQFRKIIALTEKELTYINPSVFGNGETVEVRWTRLT